MNDLENLYRQRLNQFDTERKALGQKMHRLGNVRVFLFVCMVLCLLQFFSSNFEVLAWWWLFLATVPFFAYLVKIHQKIFEQKELMDQLCLINEKEKEGYSKKMEGVVCFPLSEFASLPPLLRRSRGQRHFGPFHNTMEHIRVVPRLDQ